MVATNCKNCGAVLTHGICSYCGTDYREPIQNMSLPTIHCDSQRLMMRKSIDPFFATNLSEAEMLHFIKSDMVKQLALALMERAKWNSYTKHDTCELVVEAHVDVAIPGSYFTTGGY